MTRITMTALSALAFAILPATAQIANEPTAPAAMEEDTLLPPSVSPMMDPAELEAEVEHGTDFATEFDDDAAQGGVFYESEADAEADVEIDDDDEADADDEDEIEADISIESEIEAPETD